MAGLIPTLRLTKLVPSSPRPEESDRSRFFNLALVLVLVLAGVGGGTACNLAPIPLADLPQDSLIQVYFNQDEAGSYAEPYRSQVRPGDDLEQVLVDAIAGAEQTVEVAVQELRLPRLAQALVDRQQAGVQVRVVIEHDYNRLWSTLSSAEAAQLSPRDQGKYQEFKALADRNGDGQITPSEALQGDALAQLRQAGIPIVDDTEDGSKGSGLMHHKFVVVDGTIVITGSANFTSSGTHGDLAQPDSRGNVNHLLRIESPALAQGFRQEFDRLWGDGPGGKPDSQFGLQKPSHPPQVFTVGDSQVTLHFSPTSPSQPWQNSGNGLIGETLKTATKEVDLALFVFSEQALVDILQLRHQQGVQIRALIDPGFAFRYYSEGLDLLGVALSQNCQYEPGNRPWSPPLTTVGVPQLPEGDVLHHKFAVIDGEVVITGSHNWSAAANHNNDETLLVIRNATVAADFQKEFERLYRDASLGIPLDVEERLKADQQKCL